MEKSSGHRKKQLLKYGTGTGIAESGFLKTNTGISKNRNMENSIQSKRPETGMSNDCEYWITAVCF
ncbi:hypothetical Protein YC6258_01904 [Gynuella sunshinyii YC6258]|uniref:Uncharacterized protein n=1 Tax=Gynuella sunshinyii YC6258 TaxID=1445510 RepID=A0A0C5VH38_9GAMM|nr:hypothetical Protein YC6258_01904 [Gynuella sunshinyii YC6258]